MKRGQFEDNLQNEDQTSKRFRGTQALSTQAEALIPNDILLLIFSVLNNEGDPTTFAFTLTSKAFLGLLVRFSFYFHTQSFQKEELAAYKNESGRAFCLTCAQLGYFELAKWGRIHKFPLCGCVEDFSVGTVQTDLFTYLVEVNVITEVAKYPASCAIPFIEWARSEGCPIQPLAYRVAAKKGEIDTIARLVELAGYVLPRLLILIPALMLTPILLMFCFCFGFHFHLRFCLRSCFCSCYSSTCTFTSSGFHSPSPPLSLPSSFHHTPSLTSQLGRYGHCRGSPKRALGCSEMDF
jgi:hypothetical protein